MSKRVNPYLFRLGYNFFWKNSWSILEDEKEYVRKATLLREFLEKIFKKYAINGIKINFVSNKVVNILILTNFSMIFFTNKLELLKKIKIIIQKFVIQKKLKLKINLSILKQNKMSPYSIACRIANGLQDTRSNKSPAFLVNEIYTRNKYRLNGLRVEIKGRLYGSTMCSKRIFNFGTLSLNTLDEKINYDLAVAISKFFGTIGVKVFVLEKKINNFKTKVKKTTFDSNFLKFKIQKQLFFLKTTNMKLKNEIKDE